MTNEMKRWVFFGVASLAMLSSAGRADEMSKQLAKTYQKASGALAVIRVETNAAAGGHVYQCTGICLDAKKGLFMTNGLPLRLTVDSIQTITLSPPGPVPKPIAAELLGIDAVTGLSFVRTSKAHTFSAVAFSPTSKLTPGAPVTSIGLDFSDAGLPVILGAGYVAGRHRTPLRVISVTGGTLSSTGSVVFAADGRAIGIVGSQPFLNYQINTPKGSQTLRMKNERLATRFVPVEEFGASIANIPRGGQVRRPAWIGVVQLAILSPEIAKAKGITAPAVMLDRVIPGQPGAKAGLKNRDILLAINGKPLAPLGSANLVVEHTHRQIRALLPPSVTLTILSGDGKTRSVKVAVEPMPKVSQEATHLFSRGLGLVLREPVLLDRYSAGPVPIDFNGLLVAAVPPRTPAAKAGLMAGDVVISIQGQPTKTVAAAKVQVDAATKSVPPKPIVLKVRRGDDEMSITIPVK